MDNYVLPRTVAHGSVVADRCNPQSGLCANGQIVRIQGLFHCVETGGPFVRLRYVGLPGPSEMKLLVKESKLSLIIRTNIVVGTIFSKCHLTAP